MHQPLEEHDLVAVTVKHVDYYGYIEQIDWDVRNLSVCVQFHPDYRGVWFDMHEVRKVHFPKER